MPCASTIGEPDLTAESRAPVTLKKPSCSGRESLCPRRETEVRQIINTDQVLQIREEISQNVHVDEKVKEYIVRLGRATRNSDVSELIQYGISPRAYQHLMALSRTAAFFNGREFVTPSDVKSIAVDAMRHRVVRTLRAEAENVSVEEIVEGKILGAVSIP